ncbi:hypothetical protein ADIWIN_3973 [Winogradskyella psychrotolerans RS-3]|uniref:Uncharacterized protein n=1 Tax=Winogradskyella psychrotolerans RS-3 TaxID=641526 RepID=S7VIU7_9FLAO|nr:hypothetical protein ADIWIN_3973 [Winogradskyella psychrotolerans RS-3]
MFSVIESKGFLNFNNIYTTPRENYRNSVSSNRYLFQHSKVYNSYNSSYWTNKTLTDSFLAKELKSLFKDIDSNDLFMNGNKQK